jgi:hypothetical protein
MHYVEPVAGKTLWEICRENSKNKVFGIILKISVRRKMFDKSLRKSGMT